MKYLFTAFLLFLVSKSFATSDINIVNETDRDIRIVYIEGEGIALKNVSIKQKSRTTIRNAVVHNCSLKIDYLVDGVKFRAWSGLPASAQAKHNISISIKEIDQLKIEIDSRSFTVEANVIEEFSSMWDLDRYDIYVVEPGETLLAIAKKFNTTVNELIEWSPYIKSPSRLSSALLMRIRNYE